MVDGDEVNNHKTDPLNEDSDMDNLSDGAEVLTHKTDPLNKDTDGGTVEDGVEVERGTDPLDPDDDVAQIDIGRVYEGITFATSSAKITSSFEDRLHEALEILKANPHVFVEIRGYTDNTGARSFNMSLSKKEQNL